MKVSITVELEGSETDIIKQLLQAFPSPEQPSLSPTPAQRAIRKELGEAAVAAAPKVEKPAKPEKPQSGGPYHTLKAAHPPGDKVGTIHTIPIYRNILIDLTAKVGEGFTNDFIEGGILDYFPDLAEGGRKSYTTAYIRFLNESSHIGFVEWKHRRKVWRIIKQVTKDTKFGEPL